MPRLQKLILGIKIWLTTTEENLALSYATFLLSPGYDYDFNQSYNAQSSQFQTHVDYGHTVCAPAQD